MYKKIFFLLFLLFSALFLIVYKSIFSNNIVTNNNGYHIVYIFSNYSYHDVHILLKKNNIVKNLTTFDWVSRRMNYPNNIKPGRYIINNNLNNRELVAMLRSGKQSPIKLTLSNIYNIKDVASKTGKILEADSIEIVKLLNSNEFLSQFNLDSLSVRSRIIPNTYEFYWNTDAEKFIRRLIYESDRFWNEDRKMKAERLNLSTHEVVTLASIVQMESNKKDEYNRIAGVYLNRLKDNWPLQADPTVKYAVGKPELKRVLTVHTEFDSPYNTYKYLGLPPSPIIFPETYSIDAVLDAEKHNYYFFCAKDDFSGYHAFAKTLSEHNRNATLYHRALNKRDIF